mmetsp:Transcript_19973/g.37015  ORF Transcript_19973/g.37015 Transcript_19973/m.37015 type:complete len:384 (-) Transcript_19973:203-1354(-)
MFMLYVCTAVHLAGCIWYFNARLQNFSPDSWVTRNHLIDTDIPTLYLISVYWAFSVVTTVGFGDYASTLKSEMLIAILWMTIGVIFYSFAIGSLSTFLNVINTRDDILNTKLTAIKHFANETGISVKCIKKITAAVKYRTQKSAALFKERLAIFNELPQNLKAKVAFTMYGSIARTSVFLKNRDLSFVTRVMPCLQPLKVVKGKCLYSEGEHADEMYFIMAGSVNFLLKDYVFPYKTFVKGSVVGETELVMKKPRKDTARAAETCELLVLSKQDLFNILSDFSDTAKEIKVMAYEKSRRTARIRARALAVIQAHELGIALNDPEELAHYLEASVSNVKFEETEEERESKAKLQVKEMRHSVEELCSKMSELEAKVDDLFSWLE